MKLTVYLRGAYDNQVNKHKYTIMNCDICNEGNDQNTMVEKIAQTGVSEGLGEEGIFCPM